MTTTDIFFDTNVLLYALTNDAVKADRSEELLRAGGAVSVQVLNECVSALRRKFKARWPKVEQASARIRSLCVVVPLTEETHVRGLAIAIRYKLHPYDGMILATALLAGCSTLFSEDMQNGFAIEGLTIRNPYRRT